MTATPESDSVATGSAGGSELSPEDLAPIQRLGEVLATRRPLTDALAAFSDEVVMHADDFTMQGSARGWIRWVAFMRDQGRVSGLRGDFEGFARQLDGTIIGHGRWTGTRDGRELRSASAAARYRVVDGVIVEMWSRRDNYTLIFGDRFATPLGFWLTIARFGAWSVSHRSQMS